MRRIVSVLFAAASIAASIFPSAAAPTRSSENVRLVGGKQFSGGTDLDFSGDHAYVGSFENADG
ncbi:MAG: hypothetical protein ACRDKS_12420, partial [Actinomycetota bacterium]